MSGVERLANTRPSEGDRVVDPFADPAQDLLSAYGDLQNLVLTSPELADLLQGIAELAAVVVGTGSCGVTLRRGAELFTVGSSDAVADRLDELQYGRGRGPCLQALYTGEEVQTVDLRSDDRWGDWAAYAMAQGIRSSLSVPLVIGDSVTVGALNSYVGGVGPHSPEVIARLRLFAHQASVAINLELRRLAQIRVEEQLREALATRAVIDQALGILMSQRGITSTAAFAVLRQESQAQNRKLHLLASDLIQSVTSEPPAPPRPFIERH